LLSETASSEEKTVRDSNSLDIYYEHPDWFRPLFAELDRRAIP
jgi:hypothetical protein